MKEYTVYPGEYIPLPEVNQLLQQLKSLDKSSVKEPPVNMDEYDDYFKIEVIISGISREDILINVDENILSVTALNKNKGGKKSYGLHEFSHCCFDRHICLPANADPQFMSAEYKEGMLCFYIPKSKEPVKNIHTRIVVY